MNTLPQDLTRLLNQHLTTVEDVFINHQDHNQSKNIKMAITSGNFKAVMYFLQLRLLNDICLLTFRTNNNELMDLFGKRYDLDFYKMLKSHPYLDRHAEYKNTERYDTIRNIKTNWGIRHCYARWVLVEFAQVPHIITNLSNEKDFNVVMNSMTDYLVDNGRNYHVIRCWAAILALLKRDNELKEFIKIQHQLVVGLILDKSYLDFHIQTINNMILSAFARTDNLELFVEFFELLGSNVDMNNILADAFHFGSCKVVKYILEVHNPKVYIYHWGSNGPISDPRIARMIVNHKGLLISGLSDLIDSCEIQHYNVVTKILSTLN